ncbi:MAG: 1-acyl-sn-glycerol-3-phosphate acyltransferase [Chitinophagales bacterium]|nr:1-acyl-sn-glycerol-3-phosphate acyltransferase [Chitinophagaceae bacterium]MCB9065690.1 1-acyl-sn-glycerol-3-phosphate acyltransferase [Chitinophagales bacterium]
MHIFFLPIYDLFKRRKSLFLIVFLCSFVLWVFLAFKIKLKEDITSMLPNSEAIQTMNKVMSKSAAGEQVIFLMDFKDSTVIDPDELVVAANDFTYAFQNSFADFTDTIILQPGSGYEEAILSVVQNNLPLFLEEGDYALIDTLSKPEHIVRTLEANKKTLLSPASVVYKRLVATDPLGISGVVWNKLKALQQNADYETYDGYLFDKRLSKLTFFLKPKYKAGETGKNSKFFESADDFIQKWETEHVGIEVTYFGGPAVAAGNATQMRTDTIVTLSLTVVLLLLLTFYYFRRKRIPLLLLVPVLYGGAMGIGIITLVSGSMSVIALGAGAIVMGIAIDFSIHFLSQARKSSIRDTVKELSQPLTLGSLTTIAAFLSLRLTDTPILEDLGLFAAASLFGAALCTLIFLPHLLSDKQRERDIKPTLFDTIAKLRPESNKWLVLLIIFLTPVMLYFSTGVQFDSDLMNLNYLSPELEKAKDKISEVNADALSSVFVVAEGDDEEHALQKLEVANNELIQLQNEGKITGISIPTTLIPSEQTQKERIERWHNYWTEDKKAQLIKNISKGATELGYAQGAFTGFEESLSANYTTFDEQTASLLKSLFPGGFAADSSVRYAIASVKVPAEYRAEVFGRLKEYKQVSVSDRQESATQLVGVLQSNFTDIALYSSLIVFFALLIGYGRIELAIVAFLPMAISWIWILGIMCLLGLKFNIVNIIISSLIFGLGDDYTIFTMDGLVERFRTGKHKLASVRAAVYVSVLTVIIGLGVLLLAKHPALRSIAFISVTGLLCVLFISQTLQPFLFNTFIQHRADKRFLPFTLRSFILSVFAFTYFFVGSLLLTVMGVILTKLWPFNKEKGKYYFHVLISAMTWSMMYIMLNVRKRVYNIGNETFDKPAVYIANHSSFLDILLTTMLHPRLVLLTNRWVWRSPVFGAVVRMGEYYPVADGAEDSIEPLRDLVSRGYSVVVFPEGTRSTSDKIARFHKGAFYIAEELKLDIVPIVLHGVHYSMQKNDWLLKSGTCSLYIHPRIKPDDDTYGDTYSKRAKHLGKWMREQLSLHKQQDETPAYFKEQLVRCYTYKGPVLEWYCRVKTKLEGYYQQFHELLPREGKFYDLGCGYGFMSYMLHWSSQDRSFIGIDYDGDKIETAQNVFLRDDDIRFEQGDLTAVNLESCDGIIISDVLHYLLPEQQVDVLEKSVAALNDTGILIVRDGVSELKDRIKGTKLTELFSTKIFGFNKTQNDLHFISRKLIDYLASRHNMELTIIDNAKMTANLIFVLKKKG